MPTNRVDTKAVAGRLSALLDAGEIASETIRTYVSRLARQQLLGLPCTLTVGDECFLNDVAEAWRECAENLEPDLAAIASALSGLSRAGAR